MVNVMEAVQKAIEWMISADVPEDAMIRHLGMRHESGVRLLPVSEASRYKLPVFIFSKNLGLYTDLEIAMLRETVQDYGIVAEFVGKATYTVTVNILPNQTVVSAYNRFMKAIEGVGLESAQLDEPVRRTPLPEGWTW